MEQLIAAAFEHPKQLRQGANTGDDYGARATEAEAETVRWGKVGVSVYEGQPET
jgi:hypothetical protein